MRLICPNCGAQYNVADDAIPEGGRDVQCSSCQQTWFQTDKPTVAREASRILANLEANIDANAKNMDEDADEPTPEAETKDDTGSPLHRNRLDSAVANILREEAAREDNIPTPKAAIAEPPPTQASSRFEAVDIDETRKRIAEMTVAEGGTPSGAGLSVAAAAEAKMRTVPSINEINATLRARAEASDTSGLTEAEKNEAVQRSGFRRGFFLVLVLFAILIAPYFFADQITENLPQTRGFMAEYVNTVDQLRITISDIVQGLRERFVQN